MIYGEFADVYDQLMNDYDYDAWSEYYLHLIDPAKSDDRPLRVAECACGTGNLTVRFAKHDCSITGIDASAAMLRVAEQKARQFGVRAALVCADMRQFRLAKPADAVLATCDGVNYLTDEKDVRAFFINARRALRQGGLLCFDLSTRYKLEEMIGNRFLGEERDGIAYLWGNHLDRLRHIITMDITCFVREQDGRYRRFREIHRQRAHSTKEIAEWLHACGFSEIEVFGEMRTNPPEPEDSRIHVRAVAV